MLFFVLFSFVFAGPIAGVPNDLRREFKSVHKFKEVDIRFENETFKARLDLTGDHPVLLYNVRKEVDPQKILNHFVISKYSTDVTMVESSAADKKEQVFDFFYKGQKVKGAWVKMQAADEKFNAFALSLPLNSNVSRFYKKNGSEKLALLHGKIVEYREIKNGSTRQLVFAEKENIPSRTVEELHGGFDQKAITKKVGLPKGSFPDQIVADSDDNIWFTQPNEGLLTQLTLQGEWFHQQVGSGADGLYIDHEDGLWFGEYFDSHLGYYNRDSKVYKRWKLPYEKSAPAIPYRHDLEDDVWLTDHESNKINVFSISTEKWKTLPVPTANAWPVQIFRESVTHSMIVTECYANKLGSINPKNFEYKEIDLGVSTCPAFAVESHGLLWVTLWSGGILSVDPATRKITEYEVKADGELDYGFGPIHKDQQGNVYFGSLSHGKLYKLNPKTKKLSYVKGVGSLKDGLVVVPNGDVWATETTGQLFYALFSSEK